MVGRLKVAALAVGVLLGACRRAPPPSGDGSRAAAASPATCGYPVVVRDDRGVDVTVRAEPLRIASLLPSHTETLFALGLGARVVGVDDCSGDVPGAAALPRLGGLYDTRVESLLSLQPDLVLMSEAASAGAVLARSGVTAWGASARKFDDIFFVIGAIGKMVCKEPEAARLAARVRDDVAGIERQIEGRARVRVYYELDATPYTVGPLSFIGTMLAKAGGEDIVPADIGDFPKISPEAVIAGNPAVILGVSLDEVRRRPGWSAIAAVRAGQVYKMTSEEAALVARPGPRIADGLRTLVRRLHPEVTL
jgi:iron complex transport system substrate-binding protein